LCGGGSGSESVLRESSMEASSALQLPRDSAATRDGSGVGQARAVGLSDERSLLEGIRQMRVGPMGQTGRDARVCQPAEGASADAAASRHGYSGSRGAAARKAVPVPTAAAKPQSTPTNNSSKVLTVSP
jgi:hypothetical protein